MADNLKNWILLKNAAGEGIFPQIDLRNVRANTLLAQENVDGLVAALEAKLATADFNSTIANYSTTEQVTKAITDAIAGVQHFAVEVVEELPAVSDAAAHTIYLVARTKGVKESDVYDEYILINGAFELIGNTELDLSNYYTKGEVDDELAKKADKTTTINSKALSDNIVLDGSDIALTGYTTVEGGVGIAATDSINAAFKKIDENFKTLSGNSTESLGAVVGRVSTLEGEMDAVEGRLDVVEPKVATLESITKGYTTEGEIKAAVDAKAEQSAVDAVIGAEGTLTKAVAANTAAVATKAEKADVDAVIGAEGSLTQAVAANTAAVATKAEKEYVDGIKGDLETAISGKVAQGDFDTLEGRVDTAEGEIDALQGALEGLLSAGAVKAALDLKANAADVYTKTVADATFVKSVEGLGAVYYEVIPEA